ncbi:ATP-binding protein [Desulfolutivibrio sulfoxidireducens]|uniref:ATP-binding protein n=1 Tax=Desulfolutivibrio sulfoxidireducens TaxID=2773299 RepID=UPI00159D863F|nr:ATP-binding protein [Desulfolutivibrio sulfoxidireducens]QLA16500.1 PAS domain S-box protein [Desulfolutivibrio sulfoxidireducens]QLA19622.1 PAS domain S-box protein [Desulfolutivibrio sulfoxidireducens]
MKPFRRLSLKIKIFLSTLGVVLLISATIAMLARWILVSSLTRELELRGVAIAQSIAEGGSGYVLDQDTPNLVSLVFDAAQLGERKILISYIYIVELDGNVLAHTFIKPFPRDLLFLNVLPPDKDQSVTLIQVDGEQAYDIAVPIKEGIYTLGSVHVGLNKNHIDNLVGKLRFTFLGFISAIVVIIFLIALRLSNYITQPVTRLTRISDEISRGNLDFPMTLLDAQGREPKDCPAYSNTDLPCWHFDQNLMDESETTAENVRTCKECVFYKKRTGDEVDQLADSFSNMIWSIKLYRRRLRESEEKYRSLFDSNPDPVFVVDLDRKHILDANPRAEEVYGFAKPDLIGRPISDLEPSDAMTGVSRFLSTPQAGECILFTKVRHIKKAGTPFFVNVHACRTHYRGKEAVIFSTTDITEMVEKDAQLIQASKMKTLGEMSAGIAHELNQPLNAIKMGSDFLSLMVGQNRDIPKEHLSRVVGEISAQVDRAATIISHLREFGRKSDLKKEKVDINVPIRGVFTIIGQQLALQNIDVTLDLCDNPPQVHAHSNRLEQVFFNLVTNARDAINMRFDGHRDEGLKDHGPREISIRSWLENGRVAVTVSDTGCGISPKNLQKIFEPFFTTKTTGHGMGLGLSISYGIVKDYGGDIEVGSEPGEGTTFKLSFPVLAN